MTDATDIIREFSERGKLFFSARYFNAGNTFAKPNSFRGFVFSYKIYHLKEEFASLIDFVFLFNKSIDWIWFIGSLMKTLF